MTRLLLIRHATTDSVGKRLSGRTPGVSLNAAGMEHAEELAARLAGLPIAAVYTSPLERAVETAAPLCRRLQLESIRCEDFLELDFGSWTNGLIEEVAQQPAFGRFNAFRSVTRIPGGELMAEAQLRAVRGIAVLSEKHPDATVAVVSHGDLIKSAIAYYAGIHLDMFQRIEISPASVSILELYPETARIMLLNDTGKIRF